VEKALIGSKLEANNPSKTDAPLNRYLNLIGFLGASNNNTHYLIIE
jgi:hypothetical protein